MSKTGSEFVSDALKELQVLDPTATAEGEQLADGLRAATDLLDTWRTERLLVRGVTRTVYSLVSGTQSYTIGTGGVLNQDYPTAIERWGIIPDDDAANPIEQPRGRPMTSEDWRLIRVKSTTGGNPTALYYDHRYAAGLGTISIYPIPDHNDIDLVLYGAIPQITSLVAATTYDLPPGMQRALTLNLALELADRYGKAATVTARLEKRATDALAKLKRANIVPHESQMRSEFAIGSRGGAFNIYTGDG